MQSALDRRMEIIRIMSERRLETIDNLAQEFDVSRSTIKRDIMSLSGSIPLYTVKGNNGGIRVPNWWKFNRVYLSNEQKGLLQEILPSLDIERRYIMESIITTFSKPEVTGE